MRAGVTALGLAVSLAALVGCSGLLGPGRPGERGSRLARVVRVIDGDTVEVRLGSRLRVTRLLSIDSPEKYATRYGRPEECGSLAASAFMGRFRGAAVRLRADPTQDRRDRYGRLLRYVELAGGADLGALELKRGLAMPYLYGTPAQRYRRYLRLARRAERQRRGSWGAPCEGDFHSSLAGVQNGLR